MQVFLSSVAIKNAYCLGIGKDKLEIVDKQRANITRQELVYNLRLAALVVYLVVARYKANNTAYKE